MTYFKEISAKQAGALLGVANGTFKSRLCRAKKRLKQMAERALVAPIRRASSFPFFHRQADFEDLRAKTAEVWSREMAF